MKKNLLQSNKSLLLFLYHIIRVPFCLILYLSVSACGTSIEHEHDSAPTDPVDVSLVPDAVPRIEPRSRYGNPKSYVVNGKRYYVMRDNTGFSERGIASWYGKKFHGRRTSSGETYNMYAMTAAHKSLPLPTYVEVKNLRNQRKVVVKVNDRGPFHANRIIDLSYTAATKLGIIKEGTGFVEVRAINPKTYHREGAPVRTVSLEKKTQGFYIQAGSFAHLMNAEHLRKKLGIIGEHLININQAVVNGKTVYRVRIGPIIYIDNADRIVAQLARLGIEDHHFVTD